MSLKKLFIIYKRMFFLFVFHDLKYIYFFIYNKKIAKNILLNNNIHVSLLYIILIVLN